MNYKRFKKIIRICLIILLSFFSMLVPKMHFGGTVGSNLSVNYMDEFCWTDVLVFVAMFCLWYGLYRLVKKYYVSIQKKLIREKKYEGKMWWIWLIVVGILIVAWLPYLLSFAPGSVLGDSLSSIEQVFSGQYSNHHPVAYTLFVGIFIKIGMAFGNINIGVFLYSCFQYVVLAAALAYTIVFLVQHKVRPVVIGIAVGFFAICPIFPSYAIIMWKDPLFSIALAFMCILLYRYAENDFVGLRWYQYASLVFCAFAIIFFRNNGIFILILVTLTLFLLYRKKVWKVGLALVLVIGVSLVVQGPVYSVLKIHKPSVEAFSIPLQQIAYVVSKNEESLSEEDKTMLEEIMPLKNWKNAYSPALVDSIKWNKNFNTAFFESHLGDFMKVWIRNLPENFTGYTRAYLLQTLGFWHPFYQNEYGYIDQYIEENQFDIHEVDVIERMTGLSMKEKLEMFRPMIGTGTMVIVMLFSIVVCIEFQNKRVLLLYLTSVFGWVIIMFSTPVAFSLRYMFVVALMLPIFALCPFFRMGKSQGNLKR